MMTPSTPVATPNSFDSTNTAKAATVEASARAAFRAQLQAATDNETQVANTSATAATAAAAAAQQPAIDAPDPMSSLSTVAIAGAMNSLPAALNMMRNIAMASASGTLTDADRQTLQLEYAQLTAKVVSSVGSAGAGAGAQSQSSRREDNAENTFREDSDDHRSTLTQTVEMPQQAVQYQPVERTFTTQKQTLVADGSGQQKDPRVDFRTHELHVGTDSYEPVSARQAMTHPTLPATFGRVEVHAETQHTFVAQAAQITQFVQVAQTEHVAPLVAVA